MGRRPKEKDIWDEQGWSNKYTPLKQMILSIFNREHQRVVYKTLDLPINLRKYEPYYCYVDLRAGCGIGKDGELGSPLIFLRWTLNYIFARYHCTFAEKEGSSCEMLEQFIEDFYKRQGIFRPLKSTPHAPIDEKYIEALRERVKVEVLQGDHNKTVADSHLKNFEGKKRLGLIYEDPNGNPNTNLLMKFAHHPLYTHTDILINCNVATVKWMNTNCKHNVRGFEKYTRNVRDLLAEFGKEYWFVGMPLLEPQWTFLFGTQYDDYTSRKNKSSKSGIGEFEHISMYRLDTDYGAAAMHFISTTKNDPDYKEASGRMKELGLFLERDYFLEELKKSTEEHHLREPLNHHEQPTNI